MVLQIHRRENNTNSYVSQPVPQQDVLERAYVPKFVSASIFSMQWYEIVMHRSLSREYPGSHFNFLGIYKCLSRKH